MTCIPRLQENGVVYTDRGSQDVGSTTSSQALALDWAGRGTSHVQFAPHEEVPLVQGRFLGHGMNGGVYETVCRGQAVAWKRRYCRKQIAAQELREMEILKKLDHRHIIKLVGTYTHGSFLGILLSPVAVCDLGTFFEDVDHLVSSTTMAPDESSGIDYPAMGKRLSQLGIKTSQDWHSIRQDALVRLRGMVGCICSAIAYLHDRSIRHKDIKPSNILLSATGLWVTDFGSSTDFSGYSQSITQNGERGTPKYFAPEVAEYEPNGRPADIFSLGCVIFEMACLCNMYSQSFLQSLRPKKDMSFHANLDGIMHWFNFSGTEVQWPADQHLMALAREMLHRDPQKRPTAPEIERRLHFIDAIRRPQTSAPLRGGCCTPVSPVRGATASGEFVQQQTVTIEIGNWHKLSGERHTWRFFIRCPVLEGIIDSFVLFLHPSFERSFHVTHHPRVGFNGGGWGFFTISALVVLKPNYRWICPNATVGPEGQSLLPLYWTLNFTRELTYSEVSAQVGAVA